MDNELINSMTDKSGKLVESVSGTVESVAKKVGTTAKYAAIRGTEIAKKGTEIADSTSEFFKGNLSKYLPSIIIGSLTLVAGLSWNSAFESLINNYVPQDKLLKYNAWFKILYALILSIIIVIAIGIITYYVPPSTIKK